MVRSAVVARLVYRARPDVPEVETEKEDLEPERVQLHHREPGGRQVRVRDPRVERQNAGRWPRLVAEHDQGGARRTVIRQDCRVDAYVPAFRRRRTQDRRVEEVGLLGVNDRRRLVPDEVERLRAAQDLDRYAGPRRRSTVEGDSHVLDLVAVVAAEGQRDQELVVRLRLLRNGEEAVVPLVVVLRGRKR